VDIALKRIIFYSGRIEREQLFERVGTQFHWEIIGCCFSCWGCIMEKEIDRIVVHVVLMREDGVENYRYDEQ